MAVQENKQRRVPNNKNERSYSLISRETFQKMLTTMTTLRATLKRGNWRNLEAVIAATILDLRQGDVVVTPGSFFPSRFLAQEGLPFSHFQGSPAMAAGAAWALQNAGDDKVVVVFAEAGASTNDAWQEAIRIAAKHRLPILFVLLPARMGVNAEIETAAIARQAIDQGMIAIPVDQTDAVALYRVAFESLARARRRTGATVVICTPYQIEGAQHAREDDSIARMRAYLKAKGILTARQKLKKK